MSDTMPSTTAEHALRAVIYLCRQPAGQLVSADDVAHAIGAPRNYLSKILNTLAKAGITVSAAGRYGGFAMARPAHRITLDMIIRVFEDSAPQSRCMLGNRPCDASRPCNAHRRWTAIAQAHADALRATTVADLVGG